MTRSRRVNSLPTTVADWVSAIPSPIPSGFFVRTLLFCPRRSGMNNSSSRPIRKTVWKLSAAHVYLSLCLSIHPSVSCVFSVPSLVSLVFHACLHRTINSKKACGIDILTLAVEVNIDVLWTYILYIFIHMFEVFQSQRSRAMYNCMRTFR